jgi:hypothetical protein
MKHFGKSLQMQIRYLTESIFECSQANWICANASFYEKDSDKLKTCIDLSLRSAQVCAQMTRNLMIINELPYSQTLQIIQECGRSVLASYKECLKFAKEFEHCLISSQCSKICLEEIEKTLEIISRPNPKTHFNPNLT